MTCFCQTLNGHVTCYWVTYSNKLFQGGWYHLAFATVPIIPLTESDSVFLQAANKSKLSSTQHLLWLHLAMHSKHHIKPKHTLPQPCNQRLSTSTSNWSKLSKAPSYCSPLPAKSLVFLVQPHWPPRHWRKKSAVPRCSRYPGGSMTSWCPEARTRPYHIITWKKSSATK